jgi:hypothetical protein
MYKKKNFDKKIINLFGEREDRSRWGGHSSMSGGSSEDGGQESPWGEAGGREEGGRRGGPWETMRPEGAYSTRPPGRNQVGTSQPAQPSRSAFPGDSQR